ncbi:TonB-dependent receptor [Shewanella loihica]|uniref:TonB-dependent receptor, plug n=1 Tax=Shewanella loihica (strain ATCC BAA-1088 / PV-4) TaxID=323850 RepID=A3QJ94_SHELP|nr:TonB-dependent receptor [Shewanella loihica]ABO25542.1 TonB-dependent receptor, plug [Shewanella loihica PV-4]
MKNKPISLKLSLVAAAVAASPLVMAEEVKHEPILDVAEVIVVTGEKPTPLQQTTSSWTISADEIQAMGAQSLDEVLKNAPGVYVRTGGQGTPRVDVRGFKARHVIYLINGVPANGAEDGQFDPSVVPASQIASVTVSMGPTSVLYGPGGAGGVINIRTKQGADVPGFSGHLEGGENDTFNGDVTVAGSGERWQGLVSLSRQQTDGWPVSGDQPDTEVQQGDTRFNSDKTINNLFAQGSYWLSDNTQLMANLSLRSGEWGKPAVDGTTSGKAKFERVDDYDAHTVQLGLAHRFNELLTLRGFIYQNQSDVLENRYLDDSFAGLQQSLDGRSVVSGGNLQLIADFDKGHLLTGALIAEHQSWESESNQIDTGSTGTGSGTGSGSGSGLGSGSGSGSGTGTGGGSGSGTGGGSGSGSGTGSGSGSGSGTGSGSGSGTGGGSGSGTGGGTGGGNGSGGAESFDDSSWLYTLAAEYQYQQDSIGASLGGALHEQQRVREDESDYSAQASAYWQAAEATRLNLGVARKVRFPSMRNLYSLSSGNQDLQSETSKHLELSLAQGLGSNTDLSLAAYYTDADNYIAKDVDGIYQNMGRYQFKGVDFLVRDQSIDNLSLSFGYSFLDSEDKDAAPGLDTLEYRPRHKFRLQADYEFSFATRINLNIEHIMGQVFHTEEKVAGQKQLVEKSLDDYTLVDLKLSQPIAGDALSVYLRATNLLDERYYQSEGLPQAGRQLFLGVNWQL